MRFQNYMKNTPTKEMEEFFNERTNAHIQRVKNNIQKICEEYPNDGSINKEDLEQRASTHDISKWSPEEYIPYVFFSWKKLCEKEGKKYNMPEGMDEKFNEAWMHHYSFNDHHPEYFSNVNDMSKQQMTEMVCDLNSMSQEFNNSLLDWIKNNTFKKYNFDKQHKDFIIKIAHYFE